MKKKKNCTENEEKKKGLTLFQSIIAFFAIIFGLGLLTWIFFDIQAFDVYHVFTKKRTAEMENRFGIVVNDDITLKKYMASYWQENTYNLWAEDIDDYHSFVRNNIKGEITGFQEDEGSAVYKYKFIRDGYEKNCSVTFTKENDAYNALFDTY